MNIQEALQYIHSVNWAFCRPGLSRVEALCRAMGDPQKELRFVHVAGTNGKGSTSAMLHSILHSAGYRTGLYTSPYIKCFNERMQIDGEMISDEELVALTEELRPIVDAMEDKPTEFELITALAFAYFHRHACDIVVLEVGLGGRLDSTNIIPESLVSVITGIDFDHTSLLGSTIREIATEKAGIIKEGCPCLFGGEDPEALDAIRRVAEERNAPLLTVDRSTLRVTSQSLEGTQFDYEGYHALRLSLLGSYQPYNAATVLSALRILEARGFPVSEQAIRHGLGTVTWPARFEILSRDPLILYDGGHNPQGIAAAVQSIKTYFGDRRVNLFSGVMADKDYSKMIGMLAPVIEQVFTVRPDNPRALSAAEYAAYFIAAGIRATATASVREGLQTAIDVSRASHTPLICLGSLYLYCEVTEALANILST